MTIIGAVAVIVVLGILTVVGLRVALLLQELFKRLGRLEETIERPTPTSKESDESRETRVVNDVLETVQRQVRRDPRPWGLTRLWCFLTSPTIPGVASHEISSAQILRCAQRIIANPLRWCDYALAVDRWGRTGDVRFGGHAFSAAGAFWRVVNELEISQGYKLDDNFIYALDELLEGAKSFLKQNAYVWHDSGYHGHLLALAQYELAIRATDETEKELTTKLLSHSGTTPLDPLKYAIFRVPRE